MTSTLSDEAAADKALAERKKMLAGLAYDPSGEDLTAGRLRARKLLYQYNHFKPPEYRKGMAPNEYWGPDERLALLSELFGIDMDATRRLAIEPPFYCDYGTNINFVGDFYCNFNCHILDCAQVTIGHRVMFAPSVHVYAATHSVEVEERIAGLERAYPVEIGDDCWIGGQVTLIGPCKIGKNSTVAAGAVVRGTWPDNVVLGGVPARILKHLDPPAFSAK